MNRAAGNYVSPGVVAVAFAMAFLLVSAGVATTQGSRPAHALVTALPAPNARLAVAPDHLALTFTEPVVLERTTLHVLGSGAVDVPLQPARVDPDDPARLIVEPRETPGGGDYTVVWSTRTAEGTSLAGAYPFRTGIVEIPGAAQLPGQWPAPWAALLRWLVFLGAALAVGGFVWTPLLTSHTGAHRALDGLRLPAVGAGALVALAATAMTPIAGHVQGTGADSMSWLAVLGAMPSGWWLQLAALLVLGLLTFAVTASGHSLARTPPLLRWLAVCAGLAAVTGLSLSSHAAAPLNAVLVALDIAHQGSTLLWLSGVFYLAADWRDLGTDVSRFRTVRWIGGALFAVSVVTGIAQGWLLFPTAADLIVTRYGQVLLAKAGLVVIVLTVGSLAMIAPRHSHALRASRFLNAQSVVAVLAALLGTILALIAVPGTTAPATLAGVALADVSPVDRASFGAETGSIHLLTQPAAPGAQTVVVRLTDAVGSPLVPGATPEVTVIWTPLSSEGANQATATLQPQASETVFTGAVSLPDTGWWHAEVAIAPSGGIASRASFWLVLPDPNVGGSGPDPATDPAARAQFERGLESLTSLRSVRLTQRRGDGSGSLVRNRTAIASAIGERPAALDETTIDAAGREIARQIMVGTRRWIHDDSAWVAAEPIPFLAPAAWAESYAAATGFQLGPREQVDGELSQVVTFWQPPRGNPSQEPAWYAWWVGLASGQVRREAVISTRRYEVSEYRDFNAPINIAPPVASAPSATPSAEATPVANPGGAVQLPVE